MYKIVLDQRWGGEVLVGESDDLMLTYDCQHDGLFQWYIKHQPHHYVRHMLLCIQTWQPADAQHYKTVMDIMHYKLGVLCCMLDSILN